MKPLVVLRTASADPPSSSEAITTGTRLYDPRGVWHDGRRLIAVDTGNHRILIWHSFPTRDDQPADVVLGQPDFFSTGPNASGDGPRNGLHLPSGIAVHEDRLAVADAWNHRVLVWNAIPEKSFTSPDIVIGQSDFLGIEPNRAGKVSSLGLYWPFGISWREGRFHICDTGNRRVLGWCGDPPFESPPKLVLGQNDPESREENRGGPITARSFRWPHACYSNGQNLLVADAGNHRVLTWFPRPELDREADAVLGQTAFDCAEELSHVPQGPSRMRFPYGVTAYRGNLAIADTANNRILLWRGIPQSCRPADAVIGQPDFNSHGENRTDESFCRPYALHWSHDKLAIADSGNDRIVIWDLSDFSSSS